MPVKVPFNRKLINKIKKDMNDNVIDNMDRFAIQAHSRLVQATPVDLGQARAGWNFSLGLADSTVPPKPGIGTVLAPPKSLPDKQATKIGQSYHISNFVKHILFLNEGSSQNAPSNFVETEIKAAFNDVTKALKK